MKVLSLTEPYATLIKENKKKIETRSWKTSYRGELYIHASSTNIPKEWKNNKELMDLLKDSSFRTIINIDNVIKRSYSYGKRNYIGLSEEEQIERVYQHLKEKYGENEYAKVYLEDKEFDEALKKLREALSNKEEFIKGAKKVVKTM